MRRKLHRAIFLVLGLMLFLPSFAYAQQAGKIWKIGLFHVGLDHVPPALGPFKEGLNALGYVEGKNLIFDWRNLPDEAAANNAAKAFVQEGVDLIVAFENQTARAAKAATLTIPVLLVGVSDPVGSGLVRSLAHPDSNMTGFESFPFAAADKKLQLFKQLVPGLERIIVLEDPADPITPSLRAEVRRATPNLKLQMVEKAVTSEADIQRVFQAIHHGDVQGVYILSPDLLVRFSGVIIRLATEHGLPVPSHRKEWVKQGALFSYAPDVAGMGRDIADYADRILKGTRPGDLPVQRSMRFELVVNLKAADTLGIKISPEAMRRVDEVIQ